MQDEYFAVIGYLLGMAFMLYFQFCLILYRQHGEAEDLVNKVVNIEERHFKFENSLGLAPKDRKIIALTKFVFFILIHSLIRAIPILATFLSLLVEEIPLNVFHCLSLSFVIRSINTAATSMRFPTRFLNAIKYVTLIAGNMIAWEHLMKFGIIATTKILMESVSLTLFPSILQRYKQYILPIILVKLTYMKIVVSEYLSIFWLGKLPPLSRYKPNRRSEIASQVYQNL